MATINCLGLTFIALVGTAAVDEGTEGNGFLGMITLLFSKVFNVVRFPSHTLFFDWMNGSLFFSAYSLIVYSTVSQLKD